MPASVLGTSRYQVDPLANAHQLETDDVFAAITATPVKTPLPATTAIPATTTAGDGNSLKTC